MSRTITIDRMRRGVYRFAAVLDLADSIRRCDVGRAMICWADVRRRFKAASGGATAPHGEGG